MLTGSQRAPRGNPERPFEAIPIDGYVVRSFEWLPALTPVTAATATATATATTTVAATVTATAAKSTTTTTTTTALRSLLRFVDAQRAAVE
ncbi:MAG: hypothetical protein ABTD50_03555 [Polyangiaceae bacterium]|jgi:hypothetical protein